MEAFDKCNHEWVFHIDAGKSWWWPNKPWQTFFICERCKHVITLQEKSSLEQFESNKASLKVQENQTRAAMISTIISACLLLISFLAMIFQNNIWEYANAINEILIDNSKDQLNLVKKEVSFQTLDTLNKSLNQSSYAPIKVWLKENIWLNPNELQDYLNNFENIYMSCHRWLVPKEDIKYSFEYLLGNICSNDQVLSVSKNWYWWLKKLCWIFFPWSKLGELANMNINNCE